MINGPAGYDPIQGGMRTEMKAGPGIDISNGTISTTGEAGVPYVGGTGIYIHGATVEADLAAGYRTEISGNTIGQLRYMPIETVTGSSVTMQAGHAYKIYATSAAVTLNTETIPADSFGLEGHLEIYVAGTGYVITGTNVVLANALEPDSVNNLTARFHDGLCILSVEDHVAGYIVVSAIGTSSGSLYYGLATSTNEYIAVDAALNGQTLDMGGATTNGEKHVVGNGYEETVISGGINCTSKTTFANLGMNGVVVSSGTLTLGDVYIPSGATVAVSGGGLAVEKVTGDGGVIDLGGTNVTVPAGSIASVSGCIITGGSAAYGGAFSGNIVLSDCIVSGNIAAVGTEAIYGQFTLMGGNVINGGMYITGRRAVIRGSNSFTRIVGTAAATLAIASGATVDLTGNTNETPIAPGGGITFEAGGATVLYSSGAVSGSYMMDNVTLPAGAKLTNTAAVNLNSSFITLSSGTTAGMSGATLTGGSAAYGGAFSMSGGALFTLSGCVVSGNSAALSTEAFYGGGTLILAGGNSVDGGIYTLGTCELLGSNAVKSIVGNAFATIIISAGASVTLTSKITLGHSGGIVVEPGGCTVNGVEIAGGTYTKINNDGTTE